MKIGARYRLLLTTAFCDVYARTSHGDIFMSPTPRKLEFSRGSGVVWVCDLEGSSKALNDSVHSANAEEFIGRLFWLAPGLLEAAEGIFIKWTGDGFLGWFPVGDVDDLVVAATKALHAAFQLSVLIESTQLGVSGGYKFRVRHGISFEQNALLLNYNVGENHSLDLVGRSIVLAFRISGIKVGWPSIVADKHCSESVAAAATTPLAFKLLTLKPEDYALYFKKEMYGTDGLCDVVHRGELLTPEELRELVHRPKTSKASKAIAFGERLFAFLGNGPQWGKDVWPKFVAAHGQSLPPGQAEQIDALLESRPTDHEEQSK